MKYSLDQEIQFTAPVYSKPVVITSLALVLLLGSLLHLPEAFAKCSRSKLPAESGTESGTSITVGNIEELITAVRQANKLGNTTIFLKDGIYSLKQQIYISGNHVTVRSLSGNRRNVVIRGQGMSGPVTHIFNVVGKHFTAADLTIGGVKYHGIQIHGEEDADYPRIHNVRFVDTGQQMIKVSHNSSKGVGADKGIVEWCVFEYSAETGPDYYIGGIDAHHAKNWIVRHNLFRNIRSPEKALAEFAIHFWSESADTLVEKNIIIACDRGIGFGLGNRGHKGGVIRNNMIFTTRDVGIGLENSSDTKIYNNTVYSLIYKNSIEYRFIRSRGISIINNLTNAKIAARNGGKADLSHNVTNAREYWFVNAEEGDLHLAGTNLAVQNRGLFLIEVKDDIDCEKRYLNRAVDIGADEHITRSSK